MAERYFAPFEAAKILGVSRQQHKSICPRGEVYRTQIVTGITLVIPGLDIRRIALRENDYFPETDGRYRRKDLIT